MSLCFCSSSFFLGPALESNSAAAFWPSLVAIMACWMAMTAILLGGGACAWTPRVTAKTSDGTRNTLLFTMKTPKLRNHYILSKIVRDRALESSTNREAESGVPLEKRNRLANRGDGVLVSSIVGKVGTIGHDGRLQVAAEKAGIVGPVKPERSVHHGHQDLQLESGGDAHFLGAGCDIGA